MKKILISLFAALMALCVNAQNVGTPSALSQMKGADKIDVKIDYSSTSLRGFTEDEYQTTIPEWNRDKQEILDDFIEEINDHLYGKCDRYECGSFDGCKYGIVVVPSSITSNGNITATINYTVDGNVVYSHSAFGKGGKLGTFTNLTGDGFKSLSKIIMKDFQRYVVR